MHSCRRFLGAVMALGAAGAAWSQADPTKPSAAWMAAHGGQPLQAESGPGDAQIIVNSAARRFVIVDGNVVRPGELHNGARLVSIGDGSTLWEKGGVRAAPTMPPTLQKTPVTQAPVAVATTRKKHNKQANGELR